MKFLHLDLRALALMRIGIAALIMFDLAIRITDLEAFYANTGLAPLPMIFENAWNSWYFSIHAISGRWEFQLLLFLSAFLFAIFLFIGYRTKLFTILSWLMLLSLHNRNGLILQGGDDLLRMVLFWGIFLPWGTRYSCDSIYDNPEIRRDTQVLTIASIAYLLQITYIYTGSALLKGPEWNSDFTALYYTYSLDQIAYPIVKLIYYHPSFLKILTALAWYFELLVPVLFFIPLKHGYFRTAGVLLIILFHLINLSTLFIGLFPAIGIVTSMGILSTGFMDWLEIKTNRLRGRIRNSFCGFGTIASRIIKWRPSYQVSKPFFQNLQSALLVFLIVFVFDWNFSNLKFAPGQLSDSMRGIGYLLRLDQNWGMFAPGVFKDDGWFVMEGITKDGKHVDIQRDGSKVNFTKPSEVLALFPNDRWRKYSENLIFSDNEYMRGYYCNYSKRIWNEKRPEQRLDTVRMYYVKEFTLADYAHSPNEAEMLWETY